MRNMKKDGVVRRENWNGRYVFVVRIKGKIDTWSYVKKTKKNKSSLQDIYNKNRSFRKDTKREKLTRVTETTILKPSSLENRDKKPISKKPSGKVIQYQVQGFIGDTQIVARSQAISPESRAKNAREAKDQAWESFLERIAQTKGLDYDADEGIKIIDEVKGIKEGWVTYT